DIGEAVAKVAAEDAKRRLDVGKGRIERPTERVLAGAQGQIGPGAPNGRPAAAVVSKDAPGLGSPEDLAGWELLLEGTQKNEPAPRFQVQEMLLKTGLVTPEKTTKPMYKEILHADLDDPYLGLGETLFAHYPFAKEDAK